MIKKLSDYYNDLNMRYKLFITYLFLISIPFFTFVIVNSYFTSIDLEKKAKFSSLQVFEQGRSYLEYKVDAITTFLNAVSMNDTIQDIIKKDPKVYSDDNIGVWGYDIAMIRKQIMSSNPSSDISETYLYLNHSITDYYEAEDIFRMSRALNTPWYNRMVSRNNTFQWFLEKDADAGKNTKYISVVRKMPDKNSPRETLGLVRVDIPESVFKILLDHVAFFKSSPVFLVNSDNEVISTSTVTNDIDISHATKLIKSYSSESLKTGVWDTFKINNENYLVGMQSVTGTDWYIEIAVPYKEILASESKAIKQMLFIILAIAPITLPLAFVGSASGTKRIRRLISHMKKIQQGDFNISILPGSKDEIGELTRNFNTMITKIAILLDEKYELGQEIRSMELKALQAQINPHFLYNTLDLIYWKALRIKENSIYELVQSLSKFYKLSLSKGNDVVPLENEIEHVKAYVQIQNARFKNGIATIFEIPEELLHYKIPKITLQPIVENSIIHGILETKDEKGIIRITGSIDEDKMILKIADNGVGIPEEKLATILESDSENTFHGYGIYNINKRIKLLYGEEYGLEFYSKPGNGTTVKVILPTL